MLNIVVAIANNFAIGKDNSLLVHFPKDLKRFKKITYGNTIIMGRKTFESLPNILQGRQHVVITRNLDYKVQDGRVAVVHSLEELLNSLEEKKQYFVIGGGEIYKLLLPYCNKIYLTKIFKTFSADTFFKDLKYSEWDVEDEENGYVDDEKKIPYSFLTLTKKK